MYVKTILVYAIIFIITNLRNNDLLMHFMIILQINNHNEKFNIYVRHNSITNVLYLIFS